MQGEVRRLIGCSGVPLRLWGGHPEKLRGMMKTTDEIAAELFFIDGSFVVHRDSEFMLFHLGEIGVLLSMIGGWDHVVVSRRDTTPSYQEMKLVKRLCFRDDEWAYELHPPQSEYVSLHSNALHMWRPQNGAWRAPPIEVFMAPWGDGDKSGHINPLDSLSLDSPEA